VVTVMPPAVAVPMMVVPVAVIAVVIVAVMVIPMVIVVGPSPNLQPNGKPLVPRRQESVGATASPPPGEEKISFRLSPPFAPTLRITLFT